MKTKVLVVAFLMSFSALTYAQQPGENGRRGGDPIQLADMQTKMMVDSLSLSTKQGEKVKEINLKYANKQKEARAANTDGDWEKMRASMNAIRTELNAELKTILTQEQYNHWQKIAEEQMKHRGGNGKVMDGRGKERKNGTPPPPATEQGGN